MALRILTLVPGDSKDATQDFGPRTITVKYVSARLRAEYSATFRIDVRPDYIPDGITVTRFPKQLYGKGDSFDTSNIQVMFYRDNGARDVSSEKDRITYSWNDGGTDRPLTHGSTEVTAQYGTKVITVHYSDSARKEWTTDFQIDVHSAGLPDKKLVVTKLPDSLEYKRLEPFSDAGIEVQFFSDGGSQAVPHSYRDAAGNSFGPNNNPTLITKEVGDHEITVVYSDAMRRTEYTTYFKIRVTPNDTDAGGSSNGLVIESLPDVWEYPANGASDDLAYNRFRGEGMKVMFYSEGYVRDVTKDPGVTYSLDGQAGTTYENFHPQLGNNAGPVTVTARYGEEEAKFRVYVRTDIFYVWKSHSMAGKNVEDSWAGALEAITKGTGSSYTIYVVPNPETGASDDVMIRPPANGAGLFPNKYGITVTLTTLPGKPMTLKLMGPGSDYRGTLMVKRSQMLIIDGQDEPVFNPDGTHVLNPDGTPKVNSGALTIKGTSDNNKALFTVDSAGYLELRNGIIRDNTNTSEAIANGRDNFNKQLFGGGVAVYDRGFFLMNGGEITGCKAMFGAAIYISGMQGGTNGTQAWEANPGDGFVAEIHAGKIWGNTCHFQDGWGAGSASNSPAWFMRKSSGIVFVTNGRILMSGGEISGNKSNGAFGAVYLAANSSLYMLNGIIYGNDAKAGIDTIQQGEEKANNVGPGNNYHNSIGRTADGDVNMQTSNMGRAYAVKRVGNSFEPSNNADGTDPLWGRKVFNNGDDYDYKFGRQVFLGTGNNTLWMEDGVVKSPTS